MVLLLNISSSYALRLTRASFTMAYSESHPRIMWPTSWIVTTDQTGFCQVCFHRYIASLSLSPALSRDTALFTVIHQVEMFRAHCSFFALGKIKNEQHDSLMLPSRSPEALHCRSPSQIVSVEEATFLNVYRWQLDIRLSNSSLFLDLEWFDRTLKNWWIDIYLSINDKHVLLSKSRALMFAVQWRTLQPHLEANTLHGFGWIKPVRMCAFH